MQNKENVLHPRPKLTKKQRRGNRSTPISTRGKWTNQALEEAMHVVESRIASLKKATKNYLIIWVGRLEIKKLGFINKH
jgi:hypothetical protein